MDPQASWVGPAQVKVEREERDHLGLSGNVNVGFAACTVRPLPLMRLRFVDYNRLPLRCSLPRIRNRLPRSQFSHPRRDRQRNKHRYVSTRRPCHCADSCSESWLTSLGGRRCKATAISCRTRMATMLALVMSCFALAPTHADGAPLYSPIPTACHLHRARLPNEQRQERL